MLIMQGQRVGGLGVAVNNLPHQVARVARRFPEIAEAWPGTINVELRDRLVVMHPSHRSEPIAWNDNPDDIEVFDFLRIEVALPEDLWVPGWLYLPHKSPHRASLRLHEVILPGQFQNLDPDSLMFRLFQPWTVIDYAEGPIYVV